MTTRALWRGCILGAALVAASSVATAATFTVTNTLDSGAGSLRQAMLDAGAAGPDTITFNIPLADPGYSGGVFSIRPATPLPNVPAATTIDGATQTVFTGDTNPLGPEVFVKGDLIANGGAFFISSDGSVIKGLVISGFATGVGIAISYAGGDSTPSNNTVRDCYVGTDPTGAAALPNLAGVTIHGFASPGAQAAFNGVIDNLISGNASDAVVLCDAADTHIAGNKVGTERTGAAALPNGLGIRLTCAGSPRNLIENNVIAFNTGDGIVDAPDYRFAVAYTPDGHRSNRISANSIHGNGGLGIDLIPPPFPPTDPPSTPTPNDNCDVDAGGNLLQNFPVLTHADSAGGNTTIRGTLNSVASTQYRVEFFANAAADGSAHGEGETYLGFTDVTTGVDCNTTEFTAVFPGSHAGQWVSATATDPGHNTSEFGVAILATPVELMSFTVE